MEYVPCKMMGDGTDKDWHLIFCTIPGSEKSQTELV